MQWFGSFSKKQVRQWLGRHLLFWLAYVIFFTFITMPRVGGFTVSLQTALLHLPYNIVLVYGMIYGLIPILLRGKYRQFLILLSIFLLVCLLSNFLFRALVLVPFRTGKPIPIFNGGINTAYLTIFTVGGFINTQCIIWVATGIKLLRYWYRKEQTTQQLIRETLAVELQMLKAQIHPHFLFNTLNNLYSLTLKQASAAPDMVLKLSALLHYMLHECTGSMVPLAKEITFLENYIDLEKLRYGNRLTVTTTIQGDIQGQVIAPLLLIPFLENAFKHGSSQQTDLARIDLRLWVKDCEMTFRLENNIDLSIVPVHTGSPVPVRSSHTGNGIGLANVKKRLELIYPDRHTLTIQPDNNLFVVTLTVTLANLSPDTRPALLVPVTQ